MFKIGLKSFMAAVFAASVAIVLGCSKPPAPTEAPKKEQNNDHGWWCAEHGVVEEECIACNPKLHKEAQAKGELCPKHPKMAKSQCFICNPELWPKSAARYKDKYGKDAPLPEDNMPGK